MFVKMWMTTELITADEATPILEAQNLMRQHRIRRLPVLRHDRLTGIVTQGDIQEASPSDATSLSIWELNYLLAKTQIRDIMTPRSQLITVSPDDPIEKAALLMRERKISGLPVVAGDRLVGVITESDVFDILLNVMGIDQKGSRLTLALPHEPGQLEPVLALFKQHGVNLLSVVTCDECRHVLDETEGMIVVVVRIQGDDFRPVVKALKDAAICVLDARH